MAMPSPLSNDFKSFNSFSFLSLNLDGRYVELADASREVAAGTPISPDTLPAFLAHNIYKPPGLTDVFVFVHGWQNDFDRAVSTARRLFGNLDAAVTRWNRQNPHEDAMVPAFVAVHWPSQSAVTPKGYETIRARAAAMTDSGDAEFFLAALLGYLDANNQRGAGKTLQASGGYYVHCIGHSFGCRFLAAAIRAAARPQARTLSLLGALGKHKRATLSARSERLFAFTVDSVCFLQMAAPTANFSDTLTLLVDESPLRGPVALTHSRYDRANCLWHKLSDGEVGIGCGGAREPAHWISQIVLRPSDEAYQATDFGSLIVNVDADAIYRKGRWRPEGAHSDFWYKETIHLILSLARHMHVRDRADA
jgi:hypothetical protein